MVLWARVMTIVSAIGSVGVLISLWFSRRAVQVAMAAGRDQTRAYVEASGCDIAYAGKMRTPTANGDNEGFYLRLSVENFGATPATWFKVSGSAFVRKYREDGYDDHMTVSMSDEATWQSVFPGHPKTLAFTQAEGAELIHWAARNDTDESLRCILVAKGKVSYGTIHGDTRHADFSFLQDGYRIANHIRERRQRRFADNRNELPPVEPLKMGFSPQKIAE